MFWHQIEAPSAGAVERDRRNADPNKRPQKRLIRRRFTDSVGLMGALRHRTRHEVRQLVVRARIYPIVTVDAHKLSASRVALPFRFSYDTG